NIAATVLGGNIVFGTGNSFTSNGGNVVMLTNKNISGANGNAFTAYGVAPISANPPYSVGGGIELGSGTTYSHLPAAVANTNHTAPPTTTLSPTHPGSVTVLNPTSGPNVTGVVQVNGTGTVDLATSGSNPATLNLPHG